MSTELIAIIGTGISILTVGISLASLILTGQRNLRADIIRVEARLEGLRTWAETQFREHRAWTEAQFGELRAWTEAQFKEQRTWTEAQFKEQRTWTEAQFKEQRAWTETQFERQSEERSVLRERVSYLGGLLDGREASTAPRPALAGGVAEDKEEYGSD